MNAYQYSLPACSDAPAHRGPLATLSVLFARVRDGLRVRAESRVRRQAFLNVHTLDDRMLDDIGLTRSDVETAGNLPLEMNASLAVRQIAADRRASERWIRRR